MNCREPDGLGYLHFSCPNHPNQVCNIPCSCKSRFCSVCGKIQSDKYAEKVNQLFPNAPYYHITFSVPSQFRVLLFQKRYLLNAVFKACAETLLSFCKEQGFLPAITCVMHTFGSDLKQHIHIHMIVTAGGLKLNTKQKRYTRYKNKKNKRVKTYVMKNKSEWMNYDYFPYQMLHKRFQSLLINHLKTSIIKNIPEDSELKPFEDNKVMKFHFDELKEQYKKGFYVHVSEKRFDLKPTMQYIARYAMRTPISECRILYYDKETIKFEYKDYYNEGRTSVYTLPAMLFIKKLIQHIPPHYFNIVRHYGIIASRVKSCYKPLTDSLLGCLRYIKKVPFWMERQTKYLKFNPLVCKLCGTAMKFVYKQLPTFLFHIKTRFMIKFF